MYNLNHAYTQGSMKTGYVFIFNVIQKSDESVHIIIEIYSKMKINHGKRILETIQGLSDSFW